MSFYKSTYTENTKISSPNTEVFSNFLNILTLFLRVINEQYSDFKTIVEVTGKETILHYINEKTYKI